MSKKKQRRARRVAKRSLEGFTRDFVRSHKKPDGTTGMDYRRERVRKGTSHD